MRKRLWCLTVASLLLSGLSAEPSRTEVIEAMKRSTQYMMDSVSCHGGFVWTYLLDRSRCWGEIEANPHMMWIQSTGTPDMGELMIDAYHATGDEYYYDAAMKIAEALQCAQHPSGGWNYVYDFDGEESLKEWYRTVGASAWRLEEFQHYYGNATFDDDCTTIAATFLLRLYLEKRDEKVLSMVEKAIDFVLKSQYPCGGWPQRYPLMYDHPFQGKADYSSFITLNDGVLVNTIAFLKKCDRVFDRPELHEAARKGMYLLIDLQQPAPLAGWADQYTTDLKPAHARSYEPRSINTGTTMGAVRWLFNYYRETGDTLFLSGIPAAIDFLESQRLSEEDIAKSGRTRQEAASFIIPRFVDPDSGLPLFVHRKGGNVFNGRYYTDQNPSHTIGHYSSFSSVNPDALRKQLEQVCSVPVERRDPQTNLSRETKNPFERYVKARPQTAVRDGYLSSVVSSLSPEGYWISHQRTTSHPYCPCDGLPESDDMTYVNTFVGDQYDTSPYRCNEQVPCISLQDFISRMGFLVGVVAGWQVHESYQNHFKQSIDK